VGFASSAISTECELHRLRAASLASFVRCTLRRVLLALRDSCFACELRLVRVSEAACFSSGTVWVARM
jgi:hypothetical protein